MATLRAGGRVVGRDHPHIIKKGHRYITIVVDHDTGRLVWAAPGRDRKTLAAFFTALGEKRCTAVTHVSADAAQWIAEEVAAHCPNAVRCADPFHIVAWAGDALDQVRRDTWNAARKGGMSVHARDLKGARYSLWKNPEVRHEAPLPRRGERTRRRSVAADRSKLRAASDLLK